MNGTGDLLDTKGQFFKVHGYANGARWQTLKRWAVNLYHNNSQN